MNSLLRSQVTLQTLRFGQQLVLVWAMLRFWGEARYSAWVVLLASATFYGMCDLAIQTVTSNMLILNAQKLDLRTFNRYLSNALSLYAILVPGVILLSLLSECFIYYFGDLSAENSVVNRGVALSILGASFALGMPLTVLGSVYGARGDVAKGIDLVSLQVILQTAFTMLALFLGCGIQIGALAYLVAALVSLCYAIRNIKQSYTDIVFSIDLRRLRAVCALLPTSIFYFANPLAAGFIQNIPIFYFSFFVKGGLGIAVFSVTRTLVGLLRQISSQVGSAISIEIMRMSRVGNPSQSFEIYSVSIRFIGLVTGCIAGGIYGIAPGFIGIWTNGKLQVDYFMLSSLLISISFVSPSFICASLLQIGNRGKVISAAYVGQAILCSLSIYLASVFENANLMIAMVCGSEVASSLFIIITADRLFLFVSSRATILSYLDTLALGGISVLLTLTMVRIIQPQSSISLLITCATSALPLAVILFACKPVRSMLLHKTFSSYD